MVSRLSRLASMCCNVSRIVRLLDKRVVSSFCLSCSWSQVFRSFYHVVVLSRCHKSYTDHVCFLSFFIVCFFVFFPFFCSVFCSVLWHRSRLFFCRLYRLFFLFFRFFCSVLSFFYRFCLTFLFNIVSLSHRTCSGLSLLVR